MIRMDGTNEFHYDSFEVSKELIFSIPKSEFHNDRNHNNIGVTKVTF